MKYVSFAMKEISYSRYDTALPPEMENASEEEIKQWLEDGNAEFIEYVKHLDTESAEFAFDYEFEISEY
jgi:hypothetical protein